MVKLYPGRSEQQKTRLAEQIVKDIVTSLNSADESVSRNRGSRTEGLGGEGLQTGYCRPLGSALQETWI